MFQDPDALDMLASPPAAAMAVLAALFGWYFGPPRLPRIDLEVIRAAMASAAPELQAPGAAFP